MTAEQAVAYALEDALSPSVCGDARSAGQAMTAAQAVADALA